MSTHGTPASARPTGQHQHSQRHQAPQARTTADGPPTPTTTRRPAAVQLDDRASQLVRPDRPAQTIGRRPVSHTIPPNRRSRGSRRPTQRPDRIAEPNTNSHERPDHSSRANRFHPTGQPSVVSQAARSSRPGQLNDADQHGGATPHHRTMQADRPDSPGPSHQATGTGQRERHPRIDNTCRHVARDRPATHAQAIHAGRLDVAHPLSWDIQSNLAHEAGPTAQPGRANRTDPAATPATTATKTRPVKPAAPTSAATPR